MIDFHTLWYYSRRRCPARVCRRSCYTSGATLALRWLDGTYVALVVAMIILDLRSAVGARQHFSSRPTVGFHSSSSTQISSGKTQSLSPLSTSTTVTKKPDRLVCGSPGSAKLGFVAARLVEDLIEHSRIILVAGHLGKTAGIYFEGLARSIRALVFHPSGAFCPRLDLLLLVRCISVDTIYQNWLAIGMSSGLCVSFAATEILDSKLV